jgi:hypothetical protein
MGLSFGKLVVLAIVIFAVWYTLKRPNLIEGVTRAVRREMKGRRPRPAEPAPALVAEDLVKCARCGAYGTADSGGCGRADCPRQARSH